MLAKVSPLVAHPARSVRSSVASVLGHIPGHKARAHLATLERDQDRLVRRSASIAAKRHPDNRRGDILTALQTSDERAIAYGLGKLGNAWAARLLLDHARTSATAVHQLALLRVTRDPAVITLMKTAAAEPGNDDKARHIRTYAKRFLAAAHAQP